MHYTYIWKGRKKKGTILNLYIYIYRQSSKKVQLEFGTRI